MLTVRHIPCVPTALSLQWADAAPALGGIQQCCQLWVLQGGRWAPIKDLICPQGPIATPKPLGQAQGLQFACATLPCASRNLEHHLGFSARFWPMSC